MTISQPAVLLALPAMFAALAVPSIRRYVSGRALSLIGTWVQTAPGLGATACLAAVIIGGCPAEASARTPRERRPPRSRPSCPARPGPAPGSNQVWLIATFLLEASARDALGEREAAGRALERGLDLAEPDGLLFPFLLHPVPELLERHARQRTAHPALIRKIISVLGGRAPAAPAADPPEQLPEQLPEPLSQAEARVLRFLQTSLSAPEIARELYVSVNTIRTHMRHLYDKLGVHRRLEAIDRARALGLLAVPQRA